MKSVYWFNFVDLEKYFSVFRETWKQHIQFIDPDSKIVQFVISRKATFSNTNIERKLWVKSYCSRREKRDTTTSYTSGGFSELTFILEKIR